MSLRKRTISFRNQGHTTSRVVHDMDAVCHPQGHGPWAMGHGLRGDSFKAAPKGPCWDLNRSRKIGALHDTIIVRQRRCAN